MTAARIAHLASQATVRKRVFARFALGREDIDRIAREVAILRTASYEGRLQQLADAAGHKGEVQLADPTVLKRIAKESRDVAAGMVQTHNSDLRKWLAKQERGQSQRALGQAAREYAQGRAENHGKQAAFNEGMWGRNQAVRDVLERNGARVRVRAEPRSAAEAKCAAIVAAGWYEHRDAPGLPAHPRCVMPGTMVKPIGRVVAASRIPWDGPIIEIRTERGEIVAVGPHHPILTGRGWIAAQEVRKGDDVFHRFGHDRAPADRDDVPTLIEEIFSTAWATGLRGVAVPSPSYFHGDGQFADGDIDVVWADRLLLNNIEAGIAHPTSKPILELAGVQHAALTGDGCASPGIERIGLAALGVMSGRGVGLVGEARAYLDTLIAEPLCQNHLVKAGGFSNGMDRFAGSVSPDQGFQVGNLGVAFRPNLTRCTTSRAEDNSRLSHPLIDDSKRNTDGLGDFRAGLTGVVEADRVIQVECIARYKGHLYDLETTSRMYYANNIVTHNCVHSWAMDTRLAAVLSSRKKVWLGDWIEKGKGE